MSAPLRLVELHEEWAWTVGRWQRAALQERTAARTHLAIRAATLGYAIRARIAAQPVGVWESENPRLRFGVPDAARAYKVRRYPPNTAFPWGASYLETKP